MAEDVKNTIKKTTHSAIEYDIYLDDSVTEISDYHDIAHVLNKATQRDVINIHLSNFGGSCQACIYLVNYIRSTQASVISIVSGPCYSAGTTLALAGDGIDILPNTFLMFHNYSSHTGGKGAELIASVDHTNKWIHQYFRDLHYPFLTRKEINLIERDQDIYIHHDDPTLKERCERHFKRKRK